MQRRLDEYRWDDLRRALTELREETHLARARFSDVYGLARATVEKVEKLDKFPDYTPYEDTIRRWLEATSGEPLHLFIRRFSTDELDGSDKSATMPVPLRTGGAPRGHEKDRGHAAAGGETGAAVRRPADRLVEVARHHAPHLRRSPTGRSRCRCGANSLATCPTEA